MNPGLEEKSAAQEDLSWRPAELLGAKAGWTLPALVKRQAARFGDAPFMSFKDGRGFSFKGFEEQGEQLALRLAALGIGAGDRVFIMLKNRLEFMTVCLALSRLNAVFVPVNTELRGLSLAHQFSDCTPKMAIVEPEYADAFADAVAPHWPYAATLFMGDIPANLPAAFSVGDTLQAESVFNGNRVAPPSCLVDPLPSDMACIMYTSGTTGPPKGVLMPHAHIVLFALPAPGLGLSPVDTYYVCLPLFHANALFTQVMAALLCGARVHCTERFSASGWLKEVRDCGATVTNLLGVTSELVLKLLPQDCDTRLKAMMMVPLNEPIAREFQQRMKVRIYQAFGMTECNVATHTAVDDALTSGLAGAPRSEYFDVIIGDPLTDEPMPVDEVGEILIRPKEANAFMAGYLNQPKATADAWRNLWFHTGDAGFMDAKGRIHFADRLKDRIRRRGENISAFEIEAALTSYPCIAEAAAIGVVADDASGEQEVKAVIVLHAGASVPDMLDVYRHCEKKLPRFSVPRFYEFVGALPKTASNKVQRAALRAAGVTAATWDRDVVVGRSGKQQTAGSGQKAHA